MRSPAFLFLLPVFFVFHGFVENSRNIDFSDTLPLIAVYCVAALVLFLLSRLLFKDAVRAALLSAFILSFYFFFGALHDALRTHHIILHKYSILLPLFGLATLLLILYRKKKKHPFPRLSLFLNALLLIYILVDGISLALGTGRKGTIRSSYPQPAGTYKPCDSCPRPDIYLVIADEYVGSRALQQVYHYDNSSLDSFLRGEGFQIQRTSRSNYYATMFSMSSMLNLSYLRNIKRMDEVGPEDFAEQAESIRNNEVIHFLAGRGYSIVNNSIFDLAGAPSTVDEPLIPTKTKLITQRTLINYMTRDMGSWFEAHFSDPTNRVTRVERTNVQLLAQTIGESKKKSPAPRFIYTHLMMPHAPYLFDSQLHRRDPQVVAREYEFISMEPYLGYLPYTNARIRELIAAIKKNTGGKAVIVFMSDHGFRYTPKKDIDLKTVYFNQNTIYFPDRDYRLFYDSMTSVNEFRVLFNKLFSQNISLLKDSVIFSTDRK